MSSGKDIKMFTNSFSHRRLIGRSFSDPEVQKDINHFPFNVVRGPDDKPVVEIKNVDGNGTVKQFTPEEVSAMVLTKMKEVAEGYLGEK